MIRVEAAPEPPDFDRKVRQPGLAAIAELVGEKPDRPRTGRKRKKVAERREDVPASKLPTYWREVSSEMLTAYRRICAYLSLYIEHATGAPTVDHVIPKSKAWDRVYEWSNYRLACALMNSRKNNTDKVLDPFEIDDDWFILELVEYQVKVGPGATGAIADRVEETIEQLGLNDAECRNARKEYVEAYLSEDPIPFSFVKRRAPFIARELGRQGLLREADRSSARGASPGVSGG